MTKIRHFSWQTLLLWYSSVHDWLIGYDEKASNKLKKKTQKTETLPKQLIAITVDLFKFFLVILFEGY